MMPEGREKAEKMLPFLDLGTLLLFNDGERVSSRMESLGTVIIRQTGVRIAS